MLELINGPDDIHRIPEDELPLLAREIRKLIIKTVSKNGGHLASNLGTVELTIALHYVYDLPEDKIIWDVGHQSYTHKILSGRRERFSTLRKEGGISGFPRITESSCDSFDAGHSSTSIAAGLGYVRARKLTGKDYKVVSVIGDGALTGGLAFEALNNAASLKTNFVIVLNDNEMSISRNVGGVARYLSSLRTSVRYNDLKASVTAALEKIPVIGGDMVDRIRRTKSSIKYLFIPGMLFEDMGITYLGPIDGHDIKRMTETFRDVRNFNGPVLVHVLTQKGRGYAPARKNPAKFHGVPRFNLKDGRIPSGKNETYTDVFSRSLCALANRNSKIVAVTAAMKDGTGLGKFEKLYPQRFFDVGIAEEYAVTFCAALALGGLTPVLAVYSSFLQRAFDELLLDVCMQNQHVVLAVDRAGLVGEDGKTHQGCFDLSYLSMLPNMTVMAPKDGTELESMLALAADLEGPVAIRYPRGETGNYFKDAPKDLKPGKGEIIRKGSKVAILAVGAAVEASAKAADRLNRGVTVVNMRFVKPVDEDLLRKLAEDHDIFVTVEENVLSGGFGERVLEAVNRLGLDVGVKIISAGDQFVSHGSVKRQRTLLGLDERSISETVESML